MWGARGSLRYEIGFFYSLRHEIWFSCFLRFWDQAILCDMRLSFSYSLRLEILIFYSLRFEIAKCYHYLLFNIISILWDDEILFFEVMTPPPIFPTENLQRDAIFSVWLKHHLKNQRFPSGISTDIGELFNFPFVFRVYLCEPNCLPLAYKARCRSGRFYVAQVCDVLWECGLYQGSLRNPL